MPSYKFKHATGKDNFIHKYISYAGSACDAAFDYHEAHALMLLSAACFGVKLDLPIHPSGLRPNMYFLIVGESSFTRKSTAMKLAKDIQRRAIPMVQLPNDFTPGGLESSLMEMCPGSAVLQVDEFKGLFTKMSKIGYMSGVREMMLTLYDDDMWLYRRADKRKQADVVTIEDVSLSVIGNITPSFITELQPGDIEDGFIARFALVFPGSRPKRISLDQIPPIDNKARNKLVMFLSKVLERCVTIGNVPCSITRDAIIALDEFHKGIESARLDDMLITMIERLSTMLIKVAMLIAVGELDPDTFTEVKIEKRHVKQAKIIVDRWYKSATKFIGKVGLNKNEMRMQRILSKINKERSIARSTIMRTMNVSSKEMNDVVITLLERNQIRVVEKSVKESGRMTMFLETTESNDENVQVPVHSNAGAPTVNKESPN